MKSGSAHMPVVQLFPSSLANGLKRTSPQAIAIRYEGIEVGYMRRSLDGLDQLYVNNKSTHLVVCISHDIFADDLPVMRRSF